MACWQLWRSYTPRALCIATSSQQTFVWHMAVTAAQSTSLTLALYSPCQRRSVSQASKQCLPKAATFHYHHDCQYEFMNKSCGLAFPRAHPDKQDEGVTSLHTGMDMQTSCIRVIVQYFKHMQGDCLLEAHFSGTPDYASSRTLRGGRCAAKDDCESLCYSLLELWNGKAFNSRSQAATRILLCCH